MTRKRKHAGGTVEHNRHEWAAIRRRILERDNYECQSRAYGCEGLATEVHHKLEQSSGGNDDDDNLIALCSCCHYRLTTEHNQRLAAQRRDAAKQRKRDAHPGIIKR